MDVDAEEQRRGGNEPDKNGRFPQIQSNARRHKTVRLDKTDVRWHGRATVRR